MSKLKMQKNRQKLDLKVKSKWHGASFAKTFLES